MHNVKTSSSTKQHIRFNFFFADHCSTDTKLLQVWKFSSNQSRKCLNLLKILELFLPSEWVELTSSVASYFDNSSIVKMPSPGGDKLKMQATHLAQTGSLSKVEKRWWIASVRRKAKKRKCINRLIRSDGKGMQSSHLNEKSELNHRKQQLQVVAVHRSTLVNNLRLQTPPQERQRLRGGPLTWQEQS